MAKFLDVKLCFCHFHCDKFGFYGFISAEELIRIRPAPRSQLGISSDRVPRLRRLPTRTTNLISKWVRFGKRLWNVSRWWDCNSKIAMAERPENKCSEKLESSPARVLRNIEGISRLEINAICRVHVTRRAMSHGLNCIHIISRSSLVLVLIASCAAPHNRCDGDSPSVLFSN